MSLYAGLDVGTQGAKALVWDARTRSVVGRAARAYDLLPVGRPGAAEQEPDLWVSEGAAALREALASVDRARVRGLAVSGQQHGLVALDSADRPLRPAKLWCDTETAAEARELADRLGRPIPSGFTAPKLLWMKRREPELFERLARILLPHDWVNLWLTGRAVTEAGDASGTGLFDPSTRAFDRAACEAIDASIFDKLPELVGPDEWVGELRAEVARELGLPGGVRVAPGSGDNMMSALGAGAVRPGVLVCSLGTSGTLFTRSEEPVLDPEGAVAPFCDATGGWLPLLCTMNCTTVTEEVRGAFGLDHARATELAAAEPPGAGGLTFLPYLAGERAPDWPHAAGVVHGLRAGGLRAGRLYRAALEGATLALLSGWRRMQALGLDAAEIRLVGGGSRNPLWRRILADAFGLPLVFPAEPDSAALGAALEAWALDQAGPVAEVLAAEGPPLTGERVEPDPSAAPAYRAVLQRFDALGRQLFARDM